MVFINKNLKYVFRKEIIENVPILKRIFDDQVIGGRIIAFLLFQTKSLISAGRCRLGPRETLDVHLKKLLVITLHNRIILFKNKYTRPLFFGYVVRRGYRSYSQMNRENILSSLLPICAINLSAFSPLISGEISSYRNDKTRSRNKTRSIGSVWRCCTTCTILLLEQTVRRFLKNGVFLVRISFYLHRALHPVSIFLFYEMQVI